MNSLGATFALGLSSTNDETMLARLRPTDIDIFLSQIQQYNKININVFLFYVKLYSDLESDEDSSKHNLQDKKDIKGLLNKPSTNVAATECKNINQLPIYMQTQSQAKKLNVRSPEKHLKKKLPNKTAKQKITKKSVGSIIQKGSLGDITTENVYEIDAYDDVELGYSAGIPASKKAIAKWEKNKAEKKRIKRAGTIFLHFTNSNFNNVTFNNRVVKHIFT